MKAIAFMKWSNMASPSLIHVSQASYSFSKDPLMISKIQSSTSFTVEAAVLEENSISIMSMATT